MAVATATDETPTGALATDSAVGESFWRSLGYFGVYRLVVAAVFLVAFLLTGGGTLTIASQNPTLFLWADSVYLLLAIAFLLAMRRFKRAFNQQLTVQVVCDVTILSLLMYASGGARSGISIMLVVVVAGAGLVGQGRLTLFYAALATLAILIEQLIRLLQFHADVEDFFRTGITSIGFFATALIASRLARSVVANEELARRRGVELADQIRINRQVIQDMEDGVLVVDVDGRVRLHNPQAEALLGCRQPAGSELAAYSPALAEYVGRRLAAGETADILTLPGRSDALLVRLLPPQEDGDTLIYLQDLGRVQAQARQIKLAALGRLTANIAHEIRNPLAAITHAAELLSDEQRAESRQRLVRIIGDNSNRLNRLVGEVLELGRRDRAQPEPISLAAFFRQFIDEYALHDPDVRTRVRIAVPPGTVACFDRAHLHRVVENLITNALRYAGQGADSVRITAETAGAARTEMHIVDDGPGIAEGDRGKVFEPFFTTRGSGSGLGLYIARELCDANGAQLELLETPGGAHFRIVAKGAECPTGSSVEIEAR